MDPFVYKRLNRIYKMMNDPAKPVTANELNQIKIELNLLLDFYHEEEVVPQARKKGFFGWLNSD